MVCPLMPVCPRQYVETLEKQKRFFIERTHSVQSMVSSKAIRISTQGAEIKIAGEQTVRQDHDQSEITYNCMCHFSRNKRGVYFYSKIPLPSLFAHPCRMKSQVAFRHYFAVTNLFTACHVTLDFSRLISVHAGRYSVIRSQAVFIRASTVRSRLNLIVQSRGLMMVRQIRSWKEGAPVV